MPSANKSWRVMMDSSKIPIQGITLLVNANGRDVILLAALLVLGVVVATIDAADCRVGEFAELDESRKILQSLAHRVGERSSMPFAA